MSNIFGEPLFTDTVSKEWLFRNEHSIILNIQK